MHNGEVKIITGPRSCGKSWLLKKVFRSYLLSQGVRGDEVRVYPLSFSEFCQGREEDTADLWKEYYTYGGMPRLLRLGTPEQKARYLQRLWNKTYIDDVVECNNVRNKTALESMVDALCSSVGSLVNPAKLRNTLQSVQKIRINDGTGASYISYLESSFLFEGARRYNIRGKKYFEALSKYYAVDVGLRNARLNFRQQEITHIMDNIIYNELRSRDYLVDVGLVESREMRDGRQQFVQREVDFIATNGIDKFYIQSAYALDPEEKKEQELASLLRIDDSFRKIVVIGSDIESYTDEHGITFMGLFQLLLDEKALRP